MKISNIILTTFSVLFIVYLIGIAAEIRLRGEKIKLFETNPVKRFEEEYSSNYKNEIDLPPFKVLKIRKISGTGLIILGENRDNKFIGLAESKTKLPDFQYHKSGDTLIIDDMDRGVLYDEFKIELGKSRPEIIVESMRINLYCQLDSLKILKLKGSNASFNFSEINGNAGFIDSLNIDLKDNSSLISFPKVAVKHMAGEISKRSTINFWNSKVESAEVQIGGHSEIMIDGKSYNNPDPSAQLIYRKLGSEEANEPEK